MKVKTVVFCVLIVALLLLQINKPTIRITTFNLNNFGRPKSENLSYMMALSEIIQKSDVIALQEIRSSSETIPANCVFSEKLGRTRYKEQYGFCFSDEITAGETYQFADPYDVFERPAFAMNFSFKNFEFVLINVHVRPICAHQEIKHLPVVVSEVKNYYNNQNIILLGDLNADCWYYRADLEAITDFDTTVAPSDCAYDRIISDIPHADSGIFNITISDHYPVWVDFYIN